MRRSPSHVILTLLMDGLVLVAALVTAGMVTSFFGAFQTTSIGEWLVRIAEALTIPLDLPEWSTPYGGVFSAAMAATAAIILVIEWFLSIVRRRGSQD